MQRDKAVAFDKQPLQSGLCMNSQIKHLYHQAKRYSWLPIPNAVLAEGIPRLDHAEAAHWRRSRGRSGAPPRPFCRIGRRTPPMTAPIFTPALSLAPQTPGLQMQDPRFPGFVKRMPSSPALRHAS